MHKNPAAVALGRLGGQSTSEAKRAAARANGSKGGRPRKLIAPTTPRFVITKHGPREYAKESRVVDRTYTGMITTWDVVDTHQCMMISEHRTKREAVRALAAHRGSGTSSPKIRTR